MNWFTLLKVGYLKREKMIRDDMEQGLISDFSEIYYSDKDQIAPEQLMNNIINKLMVKYDIKSRQPLVNFLSRNIPNFKEITKSLANARRRLTRKLDSDTINSIVEAYNSGFKTGVIARYIGIDESKVIYWLNRLGILKESQPSMDVSEVA